MTDGEARAYQRSGTGRIWRVHAGIAWTPERDHDCHAGPVPIDLHWDHNAWYQGRLLRALPAHLNDVLDVGCGAGSFAARLAQRAGHVDAIDRAPHMIALARERVPPNVSVRVEALSVVGQRLLGAAFRVEQTLTDRRRDAYESSVHVMPMQDAVLTTRQVRAQAAQVLPNVQVRRLPFWRYELRWQRPR